jgi:6-pyruvoyltetrahydropterin/6-carboxytetrahydropterin synthase
MEIFRVFRVEASHSLAGLAAGHPCGRVHGHSWRLEIHAAGPVDPAAGWVMDFADLDGACAPLLRELDHAHLNDVPGLGNPTSENLARWVWGRLRPVLPALCRVVVRETEDAGCAYAGEPDGR